MTFYLWYLLIPYVILTLVILTMATFNLYHILRFSFSNSISVATTFIYLSGLFLILIISLIALFQFDWQQNIEINFYFNA
jgi:hypothetical protein